MAKPKKKNVFSAFALAKTMQKRNAKLKAIASGKSVGQLRRERLAKEAGADLQEK